MRRQLVAQETPDTVSSNSGRPTPAYAETSAPVRSTTTTTYGSGSGYGARSGMRCGSGDTRVICRRGGSGSDRSSSTSPCAATPR
ncbi:hypothetical protein [Cryptosporangium sp. NPDC051539]|uniref:hypothetical protein n=1 Tax=Cryptosporangium sp. NPDC051539 TaxID=3363962 RepID=UPI0037A0583D